MQHVDSAAYSIRSIDKVMKSFDEQFSEEAIIYELCRARVKLASKRNEALFLHRISCDIPGVGDEHGNAAQLCAMLPPRRQWHRFRPSLKDRDPASGVNPNLRSLCKAVTILRTQFPQELWVMLLNAAVQRIRERALDFKVQPFGAPHISAVPKDKKQHIYRPIASFGLDDKIVDTITARYLRTCIDGALLESCIAFRVSCSGAALPSIHDALDRIVKINKRHRSTGLYVAECDIKGFFDSVSHSIARESLDAVIVDAKRKDPRMKIDGRALEIFDQYLAAYSFTENVQGAATAALRWRDARGRFKWPQADLQDLHGGGGILPKIGVPQGGALSCLIANVVLHAADKEMRKVRNRLGKSFRYLRYCDDMILLAHDRSVCEEAYERYLDTLKSLRLPVHPPRNVTCYDARFFEGKSNALYHWHRRESTSDVPWVQFVGYQVRYDGAVRVRLKSLKKQITKARAAADNLLATLNPNRNRRGELTAFAPGVRKAGMQIVHRFKQKLIAQSVGRRKAWHALVEPMPMCWAHGFRGLLGRRIVEGQLKEMDRQFERQIQRIKRRVLRLELKPAGGAGRTPALPFYGHPFSHFGQFSAGTPAVLVLRTRTPRS